MSGSDAGGLASDVSGLARSETGLGRGERDGSRGDRGDGRGLLRSCERWDSGKDAESETGEELHGCGEWMVMERVA